MLEDRYRHLGARLVALELGEETQISFRDFHGVQHTMVRSAKGEGSD